MKKIFLIAIVVALTAAVASAAGDAAAGRASYDKACKSCHGASGHHNANIAKAMKVQMKNLGSSEVQSMSDDELKRAITDGVGKMKPVNSVAGPDLDNIVAYIRTFK